jgi:hypothetical protein
MNIRLYFIYLSFCCNLSWAASLNYYSDIQPIINRHCVSCHKEGENAPFVFSDYEDVAKRIPTILKVVNENIMPPWPADTAYVKFHNQNVLSASDKSILKKWAAAGMPKGKKVSVKTAVVKSILPADIRLNIAPVDSAGNTNNDIYTYGILDWYFKEPVYIRDYTFKIKTPFLHHSEILSVKLDSFVRPESYGYTETGNYEYRKVNIDKYLLGWFPGSSCGIFPVGTRMTLEPDKKFMVILHYVATAQKFVDTSQLLIQTTTKNDGREVNEFSVHGTYKHLSATNQSVFIPANTIQTFHFTETVTYDMSVFGVYGHAHHLCKNMLAYAVTPDGDTIRLLKINNWQFNWQLTYRFDKYRKIPEGSEVHFIATFDNTSDNPENQHNPPKDVYASFMADDEMMELFLLHLKYQPDDEKMIIQYNDKQ